MLYAWNLHINWYCTSTKPQLKKGKINKNVDRQLKLLFFFSSCFLSDYPWRQRTLDNCGQDGSVPFVPDGREDHLLSLIVNCNMQEGGLLLVQDHIGIVAQEQADGFGVALPRRKVKCGVLSEKKTNNPVTKATHPLAILQLCFTVELLKILLTKLFNGKKLKFGLLRWLSGKESACQCRRPGLDAW